MTVRRARIADLTLERDAGGLVAGIDEAGRGPWAGPVVAAAVIIDPAAMPRRIAAQIDDSKVLRPAKRVELAAALTGCARIGVGAASVAEIDSINILKATFLAMARAMSALGAIPDAALVDGNRLPDLPCPARAVVRGDSKSLSIAAASIIAKVTRDHIMAMLAMRYPGFGWERNAGYGTAQHRAALARLGVTPHHRRSYAPIRRILEHTG
jgi:ribonuclease HII